MPSSIDLTFDGVINFSMIPQNNKLLNIDGQYLSYIGYLHKEDIGILNGYVPLELISDDIEKYYMVIGFQNNLVININANEVTLAIQHNL